MLTVTGARRIVGVLPAFIALADVYGAEVEGLGYRRQPVGPWTTNDGYTFTAPSVTFGPARYDAWSEARQAVLVDGDGWDPVEATPIDRYTATDGATLRVLPMLTMRRN